MVVSVVAVPSSDWVAIGGAALTGLTVIISLVMLVLDVVCSDFIECVIAVLDFDVVAGTTVIGPMIRELSIPWNAVEVILHSIELPSSASLIVSSIDLLTSPSATKVGN